MTNPPHAWSIRKGQPRDRAVVVEFNRSLALETEGRVLDESRLVPGVEAALSDPSKGTYWLAEAPCGVIGQLMLTLEWSDWRNGWFWWLQSVYVKPDWRGRGVFRSLEDAVQSEALRHHDVCGLRLYMEPRNHRARETYGRLGWTVAGYELLEKDFTRRPSI